MMLSMKPKPVLILSIRVPPLTDAECETERKMRTMMLSIPTTLEERLDEPRTNAEAKVRYVEETMHQKMMGIKRRWIQEKEETEEALTKKIEVLYKKRDRLAEEKRQEKDVEMRRERHIACYNNATDWSMVSQRRKDRENREMMRLIETSTGIDDLNNKMKEFRNENERKRKEAVERERFREAENMRNTMEEQYRKRDEIAEKQREDELARRTVEKAREEGTLVRATTSIIGGDFANLPFNRNGEMMQTEEVPRPLTAVQRDNSTHSVTDMITPTKQTITMGGGYHNQSPMMRGHPGVILPNQPSQYPLMYSQLRPPPPTYHMQTTPTAIVQPMTVQQVRGPHFTFPNLSVPPPALPIQTQENMNWLNARTISEKDWTEVLKVNRPLRPKQGQANQGQNARRDEPPPPNATVTTTGDGSTIIELQEPREKGDRKSPTKAETRRGEKRASPKQKWRQNKKKNDETVYTIQNTVEGAPSDPESPSDKEARMAESTREFLKELREMERQDDEKNRCKNSICPKRKRCTCKTGKTLKVVLKDLAETQKNKEIEAAQKQREMEEADQSSDDSDEMVIEIENRPEDETVDETPETAEIQEKRTENNDTVMNLERTEDGFVLVATISVKGDNDNTTLYDTVTLEEEEVEEGVDIGLVDY